MEVINEMAMSTSQAMERCYSLGTRFIEHFKKLYENPDNNAVNHWCAEMQCWINAVNKIILKNKKKPLSHCDKMDWFYTLGSDYEEIFGDDTEQSSAYDKFVLCIESGVSVYCAFNKVIKNKIN